MMRKNFVGLVAAAVVGLVSMGSSTQAGMNTGYDDLVKSYGTSTDKYDNQYSLGANFSTTEGSLEWTNVHYRVTSPTSVAINASFGGWIGTSPTNTTQGSLSLSSGKGGVSQYLSTSYYNDGPLGKGIITDLTSAEDKGSLWRAYGYANVSFPADNVSWISGNSNYNVYSYTDQPDQFSFYANWNVDFVSQKGASEFVDSLGSMGATVSGVPEPASLGLLGVGAVALLARRRKV